MMKSYDVIIIGGGASGLMTAIVAARRGKHVLILEKNSVVGKKLGITGGGRCNIMNAQSDRHALLANYGEAAKFLFSPFAQFSNEDTVNFFEELGLPIKVEANNRAFPVSESAPDVVRVLETECRQLGVEVRTHAIVKQIECADGKITGVVCGGEVLSADAYVLATGGNSRPETGSTGDGFAWLRALGHTVVAPTPTLVPWLCADDWMKRASGVTLEDVAVTVCIDGAKIARKRGNVLCTHQGLSGPMILNLSGEIGQPLKKGSKVSAAIDLFPGVDHGTLDAKLLELFSLAPTKQVKNILTAMISATLVAPVLELLATMTGSDSAILTGSVLPRDQRRALIHLLKALPVTVSGLAGFEKAIVADGGVALSEIDMKTMRSKKISNLFVTGDLLHINRPSGGFSLQLCWTTGFVAGMHCSA
jgi:predicted Rossmann fold flavoprotein